MENIKPNLPSVNEDEEDKYDMEKAAKKHKEVAFVTDFINKDIQYTLVDTERQQKRADVKAANASAEVNAYTALMDQRVDDLMANVIMGSNFDGPSADQKD